METKLRLIESYFLRHGQMSTTKEAYEKDFVKTISFCQNNHYDILDYLSAIFYPRFSEKLLNFQVRPKHLYSTWATNKYQDYLALGRLDTIELECKFIDRTFKHIKSLGVPESVYFGQGLVMPMFAKDLIRRNISVCYCVTNPVFLETCRKMPNDIKSEIFEDAPVYYIEVNTKLNKRIMEYINQ